MFALEQLTVAHNEADLDAWSTSVDHIRATPGFGAMDWPDEPMTLARNELDLRQHEVDFANRAGFTYSVVNRPGGRVIGCVYIYPPTRPGVDADVRSWVRASHSAPRT